VRTSPVPIDMRAMKALKRSPLALDIYFWLTYRLSYLRHARVIPWAALQLQFGSSYGTDGQTASSTPV
ncbi:MAG: replication protein RepA, partial [Steroidobacteraceae bacterium]